MHGCRFTKPLSLTLMVSGGGKQKPGEPASPDAPREEV